MRYWLNFRCQTDETPYNWHKAWDGVGVCSGEVPRENVLWLRDGVGVVDSDNIGLFIQRLGPNYLVTVLGEAP